MWNIRAQVGGIAARLTGLHGYGEGWKVAKGGINRVVTGLVPGEIHHALSAKIDRTRRRS
jgi:hypothetical protein